MVVRAARDEERTVRTGGVRRMRRVAGAGGGARWPDDEDELEESESELESAAHKVVGRELAGAVSAALAVEGWRSAAA